MTTRVIFQLVKFLRGKGVDLSREIDTKGV